MVDRTPWRSAPCGSVYVAHFRVRFVDLDPMGHVNNSVYLNWIEQAAIDHATRLGHGYLDLQPKDRAFIAHRHELDYLSPAYSGDTIRVTTWPEEMKGARAHRRYLVTRLDESEIAKDQLFSRDQAPPPTGPLLMRAITEWAHVAISTGRPQRIEPEVEAAFTSFPEE